MKKVKVTKEQAEAIEKWENGTQLLKAAVVGLLKQGADEPIAEMPTETLAKAIYIGYEVEPEFKVGDWVHVSWSNTEPTIHKVFKIGVRSIAGDEGGIEIDWDSNPRPPLGIVRHATPQEIAEEKERRWWKKHGRKPWELRYNDTLICDKLPRIVDKIADFQEKTVIFTDGDWEYFDNVKEEYKVLVFAKDRLDVKTDD